MTMDNLQELRAAHLAAVKELGAVDVAKLEAELTGLRRRYVELERAETATFGLNGSGDITAAQATTAERVLVQNRMTALQRVIEGQDARRKVAGAAVASARSALRKGLAAHFRRLADPALEKVAGHLAAAFRELSSLDTARADLQRDHGVGVAGQADLWAFLNGAMEALGRPAHLSPTETAERAALVAAGRERSAQEGERWRAEEIRHLQAVAATSGISSKVLQHARDKLKELGAKERVGV